jgi:putative nucleotidyltransferase with HDIG domain
MATVSGAVAPSTKGLTSRGASPLWAMLDFWAETLRSADPYTYQHCRRVAGYAVAVAVALGLEGAQLDAVRLGAGLHDVGKIRLPPEILNKRGRLSDSEYEVVKMHPEWGLELLAGSALPRESRWIIRWHHEKRDGSGYPDALCGNAIPIHPMIIGIADVFDALTTERSYRPALPLARALAEMRARRAWWHDEVYAAFESAIAWRAVRVAGRSGRLAAPAWLSALNRVPAA